MSTAATSAAELNLANTAFWQRETARAERRLQDPDLVKLAWANLQEEAARHIPIGHQKSFEMALQDAEGLLDHPILRRRIQRDFSIRGGKARKPDALQRLISEIVRARPTITEPQLRRALEAAEGRREVVQEIADGEIWFLSENGKDAHAPLSGLKDRLSRTKGNVNSR